VFVACKQSYSGGTGPADWGQLGFSTCSTGALQSPIDIKTVSASTKAIDILNIAVLDWQLGTSALPTQSLSHSERPTLFLDLPVNSRFADSDAGSGNGGSRRLLNAYTGPFESYDGHTFTVTALGEAKLFIDGATYLVQEMRTHTPSEHTVDGKHFDMELQIVHTLSDGGGNGASSQFVVVSVFFTTSTGGAEPTFLKQLADTIGMDHFGSSPRWLARYFSFSAVAGALRGGAHMTSYYKYQGSLTQPPCTEGVTWFVIKQPLSVSAGTLGALSGLQGRNNRPVQPGHNRLVEFTP
jgi:carbonic anhydrase